MKPLQSSRYDSPRRTLCIIFACTSPLCALCNVQTKVCAETYKSLVVFTTVWQKLLQIYIFTIVLGLEQQEVNHKWARHTVNTSNAPHTLVSCYNCELPFYITGGNIQDFSPKPSATMFLWILSKRLSLSGVGRNKDWKCFKLKHFAVYFVDFFFNLCTDHKFNSSFRCICDHICGKINYYKLIN